MNGINEIQQRNAQSRADLENSRKGRFTTLRNGGILLSCNGVSKTLEKGRDDEEIKEFLDEVRGANSGKVRLAVERFFEAVPA
jgi:hypothetical protein